MNEVYVVTYSIGKNDRVTIAGVYTDEAVAKKVRMVVGFNATMTPIKLNHIHPGYLEGAKQLGIKLEAIV